MYENSINSKTQAPSEKNFGIVFFFFFFIVGVWPVLTGDKPFIEAYALALTFLLCGYSAPIILRPLNLIWFKFGLLLNKIISPIILFLIYVFAFLPTGLALKLLGKDILSLKLDKSNKSYWQMREDKVPTSMKDQF